MYKINFREIKKVESKQLNSRSRTSHNTFETVGRLVTRESSIARIGHRN